MNILTEAFRGRKILITGGLGFIGSNLARRLDALGAEVSLVDSLIPEYGGNRFNIAGIEKNLHVNISDVRDEHSMRSLVQGQDFLFNLAGQTSHLDSMNDPNTDLEINCRAQLSILETCRKHNPKIKIIFASTRQLYGKPDYLPVDEKHLLRPVDVNGINKMAGEWYHILYNNVYGLRGCALRLTNTYGPRMRVKDARQTFLGIWIRLLVEKKRLRFGRARNCAISLMWTTRSRRCCWRRRANPATAGYLTSAASGRSACTISRNCSSKSMAVANSFRAHFRRTASVLTSGIIMRITAASNWRSAGNRK
jgi:nucleoside-diphosphate-sugar epimerase